jgi:hypothetical protein
VAFGPPFSHYGAETRREALAVPDKRTHRGPHPDDSRLFAAEAHETLRAAVHDLSWLYSRGYASASAMKIVGDRYALEERQRTAVARCSCSDEDRERRGRSRAEFAQLAGQHLSIDGYNVLTSIEAALGGGVILKARDGCFRDMASVHGTWRKVQETVLAVELAGRFLAELGVLDVAWLLDSPVSNSGRLKTILQEAAQRQQSAWTVELVPDPDRVLRQTDHIVATADSGILDQCGRWVNLARAVIERFVPQARIVDLG